MPYFDDVSMMDLAHMPPLKHLAVYDHMTMASFDAEGPSRRAEFRVTPMHSLDRAQHKIARGIRAQAIAVLHETPQVELKVIAASVSGGAMDFLYVRHDGTSR